MMLARVLDRHNDKKHGDISGAFGGRQCAVFEYCGESMSESDAKRLLS